MTRDKSEDDSEAEEAAGHEEFQLELRQGGQLAEAYTKKVWHFKGTVPWDWPPLEIPSDTANFLTYVRHIITEFEFKKIGTGY